MIGVSLPFEWLCGIAHTSEELDELLGELRRREVRSIELRTVRPNTDPAQIAAAAKHLWENGFEITVHAAPRTPHSALEDIFTPLSQLWEGMPRKHLTVVLHPFAEHNAEMLSALSDHARAQGYPIRWALENNRLLPDRTEGDSTVLVLSAVEEVDRPDVGICFDMGHYLYYRRVHHRTETDLLPDRRFLRRVIHTHIHALNGLTTHHPLSRFDLPLASWLEGMHHCYFGVYNVELDFPRFQAVCNPEKALYESVDALREAMPMCARLYDSLRDEFDRNFLRALSIYDDRCEGTRFALIHSSSFLFQTNGFRWAMDVAFRSLYDLAETPHRVTSLLSCLDLMVISHGHEDHFEERTVRALAKTEMLWLIPDFLVERALSLGVREEKIITATPNTVIRIGPLHIRPFCGRHFRPVTGKGTEEYGYHISADGSPSLAFPVDTRDFSLEGLPELPDAEYCFANVWLGDKSGFEKDHGEITEQFARFMLHFSRGNILFAHLYESTRTGMDMWRDEHAEEIARVIHEISPNTNTAIPRAGEIIVLE